MEYLDRGYISPFWFTALIFTRAGGQCFITPVIVHQAEKYTQDLQYIIPKYWVVHNTTSGYRDRDGWMKVIMNFKTVCGANKLNTQVLFYDIHDSHFYYREINIHLSHHINPFIIKAGDSVNDQPNYNGPNLNMKGLYGKSRMNWQRHHGTLNFTNAHMNYILVEIWRYFHIYSSPVIINAFKKKNIVPLTPPDEDTNTQVCLAAAQTPKEKMEEIEVIARASIYPEGVVVVVTGGTTSTWN